MRLTLFRAVALALVANLLPYPKQPAPPQPLKRRPA